MAKKNETALVITSIFPEKAFSIYQQKCEENGIELIVIGDEKSADLSYKNREQYWSLERQSKLDFSLAQSSIRNHYSRKNLGYLIAASHGVDIIIETDDDNFPISSFWENRKRDQSAVCCDDLGWINAYQAFTDKKIWPRGFPLKHINERTNEAHFSSTPQKISCQIQQRLVNKNPDVDAIYRLTYPLPFSFEKSNQIALGKKTWCPFNSQNTTWFKESFPLLYLPTHCSSRSTDIWRSFIAQRIAWENGWHILFQSPNMEQDRNSHDLLVDFEQEILGYKLNHKIAIELERLNLKAGERFTAENLFLCYEKMVELGYLPQAELPILSAWISDINVISVSAI